MTRTVLWAMSWVMAGIAAVVLLAACEGGGMSETQVAPPQEIAAAEPDREIIRNADMALRVDDVRETVDRIDSITAQAEGRIASKSVTATGDSLYAFVTARVPADRLDSVIAALGSLGEITSLSVVAEDVTAQGADLDARIQALQASITRLRELLAAAQSTKDLIEVEAELTTRQAELDSLVAQRSALSDLVALSTLNVSVSPSSEAAEWSPPGFASGLQSGWNALRTLTAGLITLVGFLLPFVAVVLLAAIPVIALILVLRRRR